MNLHFLTLTLICITLFGCSSEKNKESTLISQRVLPQNVVASTFGDVLFSQLTSMASFDELIVASDNQSNIVILNNELELLRHTNIRGRGPGEAINIMGLTFGEQGIMFYNHERSVISVFNSEFKLIREVPTHSICCFSFIYTNNSILSAVNRSNNLFSKLIFEKGQSGSSDYVEFNSNFTFNYAQSDINHNQFKILQFGDNIILAGISHPTLYLFDSKNLELIDMYQYNYLDFLGETIAYANQVHTDVNRARQTVNIVQQARIFDKYVYLLLYTQDGNSRRANSLLVFELTDQSLQALSLIELVGQDSPRIFKDFVVLSNDRIVAYGLDGSFYDYNVNQ